MNLSARTSRPAVPARLGWALAAWLGCTVFAGAWTEDDFVQVSPAASPRVAYALQQDDGQLRVAIEVHDSDQGSRGTVNLGVSAAHRVVLGSGKAATERTDGATRYTFTIPGVDLVGQPSDWNNLRLAFAVAWPGGPFNQDLQREHFFQSSGATFDGLSSNPQDWLPFDLAGHAKVVANRKARIFISFDQPMDGKATIVIEDAQGRRVRNLISGLPFAKGPQKVEWDGLDDNGNVAPAGAYRWRGISHPGITPHYLFSYDNYGKPPWRNGTPSSNWFADESNPVAAANFQDRVYLGAPQAESGHFIIQLDLAGNKTGHVEMPSSITGNGEMFMAADANCIYAVIEAKPLFPVFGQAPDGKWTFRRPLSLLRWNLDFTLKRYDGQFGEKTITDNLYTGSGPKPVMSEIRSTTHSPIPNPHNLAGAALLNGKFYISLRQENRIVIIDADSGQTTGEIKLDQPGLVATDGKSLLVAFSGGTLMKIDPATLQVAPLFKPALSPLQQLGNPEEDYYGFVGCNPTGMAISGDGEIFLSDNGTDQDIKAYDQTGRLLREIGKKGGRPLNGPWDPSGVSQPHGITVDQQDHLWVTETSDFPRRNSVWDAKTGALVRDYLGPPYYGAPGGGIDAADHTRWLGGGMQWKLDFDKQTATPVSTLYHKSKPGQPTSEMLGMRWHFYHEGGRTFLLGAGYGDAIYELMPDGSARLWAFCTTLSNLAQMPRWTLPKAITDQPAVQAYFAEAAKTANPPVSSDVHPTGTWGDTVWFNEYCLRNSKTGSFISLLWVDKNGDGIMQPGEIEVFPDGDYLRTQTVGADNPTLDLALPAILQGKDAILHLKPDGFLPSGAPNYNLDKALASAVPVPLGTWGTQPITVQDRFGRVIVNVTPMTGLTPEGKVEWTFPNNWVGVGGSHMSPLPEPGVMQGANFFMGTAPLDETSEVTVVDGNHGRFFVLTTDGFYLDEIFHDVRVTQVADAYLIGGEPFGGTFEKCEDGKYYLQSGHTDYRVFRIDGLDQIKRYGGALTLSPGQVQAAQTNQEMKATEVSEVKAVDITDVPDRVQLQADPRTWPVAQPVIWGNHDLSYPYAEVRVLRRGGMLHLGYTVKDPSPWRNHGTDITELFKTGDCVDFEFSTDPKAKPDRNAPVLGDKRLLIAPHGDGSIAMLYTFHQPGGTTKPVVFTSPAGTESVDSVTELTSAKIAVQKTDISYTVTVDVPLADLGLPPAATAADLLGDFGVIYGDEAGTVDDLRSYWSNQATGLVNDLPGEVRVNPKLWGTIHFPGPPTP
jgi:hypothetical protein